jgi:tetratricopeptide (TPR) repeat protein
MLNGKMKIKAVVEIIKGEPSESNIVTVNFLKRKMSKAMRDEEETIQFLAEYSFKRGFYDDARAHVQSILEANLSSISALALLGNIEEKEGDLSSALSTYVKALEEFEKKYPDLDEPPEGLISNIERLLELLNE